MAFVRLFIGNVRDYLIDPVTKVPYDVSTARIWESESHLTGYAVIDTVPLSLNSNYVETPNARLNYMSLWYKVEFVGKPDEQGVIPVYATTQALLPEELDNFVNTLREWFSDVDNGQPDWQPAWEDHEYIQHLRFALKQHKGTTNLSEIEDEDWIPLQILVRSVCANIIAYDHSRYYKLQVASAQMDKSEIAANYLRYAADADRQYREISGRLNMESGGYGSDGIINQMPAPNVTSMRRVSRVTGLSVTGSGVSYPTRRNSFYYRELN